MNIIPYTLFEAFDQKIRYQVDPEHRKKVESLNLPISSITIYKTLEDPKIYLYEFKYKDAWEFHFNLESLDVGYAKSPKFKKAEYNKIIATLVDLMISRINKNPTDTYRIYGVDKKMTNLYLRVLKYVTKKQNLGQFFVKEVNNFKSATGDVYSLAYEIQKDTRTLKTEDLSERYL